MQHWHDLAQKSSRLRLRTRVNSTRSSTPHSTLSEPTVPQLTRQLSTGAFISQLLTVLSEPLCAPRWTTFSTILPSRPKFSSFRPTDPLSDRSSSTAPGQGASKADNATGSAYTPTLIIIVQAACSEPAICLSRKFSSTRLHANTVHTTSEGFFCHALFHFLYRIYSVQSSTADAHN